MQTIPSKPAKRRFRLWCFRLGAIATPFVMLTIVEWLLVWFDCGRDVSLVVAVQGEPQRARFQLNGSADYPLYGKSNLRGPEERRFDVPKPADTYRIVVFGESTVAGFPYPAELAFPRQLEVALQAQMTDRRVEVLNAGVTAIHSRGVQELVRQVARCEPDLVIIHVGHNEFYAPGGAASSESFSPIVYSSQIWLRRQRLFQVSAGRWSARSLPAQSLMQAFATNVEIELNGAIFRRAEDSYRSSLRRMVETTRAARIPILLTTVACNLRDQSPLHSLERADLSAAEKGQWQQLIERGIDCMGQQQWSAALRFLDQAEAIDDSSALVAFRRAECLESLDRGAAAREAFERARDLDGCRFRAPGSFRRIVREVADESRGDQVYFVDVAAFVQRLSGDQSPGHDLFLDHVHYNFEGNWQIALMLSEYVNTEINGQTWDPARVPSDEARDQQLGVVVQDHVVANFYVLELLQSPPCIAAADATKQLAFVEQQIKQLYDKHSPEEAAAFGQLTVAGVREELLPRLGAQYMQAGMPDRAFEMFERNVRRHPWSPAAHMLLAGCAAQQGDSATAAEHAQHARDLSAQKRRR